MASPWVGADVEANPLERAHLPRRAHKVVLSGGEHPAVLREVVLSSWLRCREAGVDPDRPAMRLLTAEQAASRLAAHPLARQLPLMRSLLSGVAEDARHIMVLSDADGLLLWAEGHPKMLSAAATTNFVPGGLCTETAAGTNAVGTTLVLDHPLQIFSAEHYSSLFHGWACSAAPIHDPGPRRASWRSRPPGATSSCERATSR
jgi:transcriptional regulator of acetoin/glycerol metabolism